MLMTLSAKNLLRTLLVHRDLLLFLLLLTLDVSLTGAVRVMASEHDELETEGTASAEVGTTSNLSNENDTQFIPYYAPYNPFVVPVNGFISPTLIAITLITNCAVCAVLLRPHMRSPTNILLVAIATSDMLTG